jgi:hypothetical protein
VSTSRRLRANDILPAPCHAIEPPQTFSYNPLNAYPYRKYETHSTEDIYDDADVVAALEKFENDLKEAANAEATKWILVMGHYPILSVAEHGDNQQLSEVRNARPSGARWA